jgi:alkylation response protein AidB-like acyl-CoA dehydrogenase
MQNKISLSSTEPTSDLISRVKTFVKEKVIPVAAFFSERNEYPTEIIEGMKDLGIFGLNIPKLYGGYEADEQTIANVIMELSAGWLSPVSLLGSHLRVCAYIVRFGTEH